MTNDVFRHVSELIKGGQFDEAISLCQAELRAPQEPHMRPHIASALCVCLSGLGRSDDAALYYDHLRDELLQAGGDFALTAALASRHHEDVRRHFSQVEPLYQDQAVGFSSISSIDALSKQGAIRRHLIDPPQLITEAESGRPAYMTDPVYTSEIPSGEFVSGWDFVFTQGRFLSDSGYMPLNTFTGVFPYARSDALNLIAHIWPNEVEDIPHTALFLSTPRAFHIGHFIVDFLPRLRCIDAYGPNIKIAIPREMPQKLLDLLACFGVGADRLVLCDLGKRYRFATLIVAQVGSDPQPNPKNIAFVRAALAPPAHASREGRRLFLHRKIGTRQIANQADVDAVLAEFDIDRINVADLSIAQQRALLSETNLLVGIYGSDLLACVFVPRGAHALELLWEGLLDTTIGPWCRFSGLQEQYLRCHAAPETGQQRMKKDRDIIVDCDALRTRLRAIC